MYKHTISTMLALLAVPAVAAPAGYFQVPGTDTTLKVFGQIQLREAYGLNGDGMATDPTNQGNGSGSYDIANSGNEDTRQKGQWSGSWRAYLGVTTTTPSAWGDVVTTINGRFKNNDAGSGQSVNFNLEQAFIQIGGLKVGTDWSLFGYAAWEPNTLFGAYTDENGTWPNVRQITYLTSPIKGLELGVSLEGKNNGTDRKGNAPGADGSTVSNSSNGTTPNISAVAAYTQDWGGVTAAINFQQRKDWSVNGANGGPKVPAPGGPVGTPDRSGTGFSWFLSGGWNITPQDLITAMVLNGGEPYGTGRDGFYADPGDPSSYGFYRSLAYNVSYTHKWNDEFSSALTIGQAKWNQDASAGVGDDYKLTEFIVNTTWQMTKTVSLGAEYQHSQLKASNSTPFSTDVPGELTDTNKLDQFRFRLKATLF